MQKTMPSVAELKARKKSRKPSAVALSPAVMSAITRVAQVSGRDALRNEQEQRAARAAMAETLEELFATKMETDPEWVDAFFRDIACAASAVNRKKILKHIDCPEDVREEVSEHFAAQMEAKKTQAKPAEDVNRDAVSA